MSTLLVRPGGRNINRHPATGPKPLPRPKPRPRPFGEGILEPSTPGHFDLSTINLGSSVEVEPVVASTTSPDDLARRVRAMIETADRLLSGGKPKPGKTPGDLAFDGGYQAGRDGRACVAPRFAGPMSDYLADQWLAGHAVGDAELCDGLAADAWDRTGFESIEDAELAEARMTRPTVYCLA